MNGVSPKGFSVCAPGIAAGRVTATLAPLQRLGACTLAIVSLLGVPALLCGQSTYTWNGPSGGAWLTAGNWNSASTYPGVTAGGVGGADGNAFDTAVINTSGIASIGINMGGNGGLQSLGAIQLDASASSLTIGNSSTTTAGILQLNGATVNSIANVLLADTTTGTTTLTITNKQGSGTSTMGLVLGVNYGTMLVSSGNTITIASIISDGGNGYGFTLQGGGNLTLTGVNTYTGPTTIAAGKLTVGPSAQSSTVNLTANGVLAFSGTSATLGGLAGTGAFNLTDTGSAAVALTFGKLNVNSSQTFTGVIGGLGGLTKTGYGIQTLTGLDTFAGAVTITQGILSVAVLADGGQASGIGESSASTATNLSIGGGTLQYTGAGASTNRQFTFTTGTSTLDASGTGALVFTYNGTIAGKASTATVLYLSGSSTAANTLAPAIAPGAGGTAGLSKYGSGTWVLAGANTYAGATTVYQGILVLDFASSYEATNPTSNIINSTALNLGGGTLSINGKSGQTNSQTFTSLTIYPGTSALAVNLNGAAAVSIALGAIARSGGNSALAGSVVDFPTAASLGSGTITTTTANGSNAILGGYATVGGTTWAVSTAGAITGLTTFGSLPASGVTTLDVDGGGSVSGAATINSLRFNGTGSSSLTIAGTNILTIASGGILMTNNATGNVTISGGTLTSTASDFDVIQNSTAGTLTIGSKISGGSNGQFTKAGPGTLILTNNAAGWNNNTFFDGGVVSMADLAAWHGGTAQTYSVFNGGALQYTGTTAISGTTTRGFTVLTGGATLDGSGSGAGALVFSSTALLNIVGQTSGTSPDPGNRTLTLTGTSASSINNTFTMVIPDTYQGGYLVSVLKTGSNTWVLNAGNTYTGGTTVGAGTLVLDFSTGNSAFFTVSASASNSVTVSETGTKSYSGDLAVGQVVTGTGVPGGTTITAINGTILTLSQAVNVAASATLSVPLVNNILAAGSPVTLAGGTLSIKAAASGTSTQAIGSFTLAANTNDTLTLDPNGANLNVTLAFPVRYSGSALTINSSTGVTIYTSSGTAGALLVDANGTAYAVFSGNDWAAKSTSSPTIVGVSTLSGINGYTADSWSAGNNTDVTQATNSIASGSTTGSLRFNTGAATVRLANTNSLTSGGILVTSAVGGNLSLVTGGTLKGPSNGEFVVFQNNAAGNLQLDTVLADGGNPTGLTKTGSGTLILSQSNTYTGQTTILQGTLQLGNSSPGFIANTSGVVDNGSLAFHNSAGNNTSLGVAISGAGNVAQSGGSTTTFTAANTYSGGTMVTAGTLLVANAAGSGTGAGGVAVSGGLLGGAGTISGPVTVGNNGTIRGDAAGGYGTLNINNNVTLNGASGANGAMLLTEVTRNLSAPAGSPNTFVFSGGSTPAGNNSLINLAGSSTAVFNLGTAGSPLGGGNLININLVDTLGNLSPGESYTFNLVKAYQATPGNPATTNFSLNGAALTAIGPSHPIDYGTTLVGGSATGANGDVNLNVNSTNGFANSITGWSIGVDSIGQFLQLFITSSTPTPEPAHVLLVAVAALFLGRSVVRRYRCSPIGN